jgi:tetratricopeptide (TPR) repeat protein
MMKSTKVIFLSIVVIALAAQLKAQDVGAPTRVSQSRTTTANIGKSDITIKYHSPSVNGRKIFGGLVPYDFVVDAKEFPWRAGSNERTRITFSHDVKVEGKLLKAGEYGFVVLVSEKEWTLIFSSGKTWGAFNYDKNNDVLRVPVKTRQTPFQEWLSYEFANPESESVDMVLRWESTAVSFHVETDALSNIIADLEARKEKTAIDYQQLAIRTLEKNARQKAKALQYLELSKAAIPKLEERNRSTYTFNYKVLKGELLISMGKPREGKVLIQEALDSSTGFNVYYYALDKYMNKGEKEEALRLLAENVKRQPDNYPNHLALGEIYQKEGNQKKAVEHFKRAYELNVEQKSRGANYAQYMYLQNKLMLESGY